MAYFGLGDRKKKNIKYKNNLKIVFFEEWLKI